LADIYYVTQQIEMTEYINNDESFKEKKVKQKGKLFELLIGRIEEAKKSDPKLSIEVDKNLLNTESQKRQFDVVLTSDLNGHEFCIAIECKEYTDPIDVTKIESYKSKCERVPQINKMVFASISGYTKGAILAAKTYGIELINIEELETADIFKWTIPLKFSLQKRFILITQVIARTSFNGVEITNPKSHSVKVEGKDVAKNLHSLCVNYVVSLPQSEWESWFKDEPDRTKRVDFKYGIFADTIFEISCKHQTENYTSIYFRGKIWEELISLEKSGTKEYKQIDAASGKAKFVQLSGTDGGNQKVEGEIIKVEGEPRLTINVTLIENDKVVAVDSRSIEILKAIDEEE